MVSESLLKRLFAGLALLAWLALAPRALAQGEGSESALREPERITLGSGDQFLGQLTPDEKKIYFVTNRETRKEIYAQELESGRAHIVFDEGADVTWPRVSPDGKLLLYVSFRERATGELCVRSLPAGGERRCLDGAGAALQAEWLDPARILVVSRTSIDSDLLLSEVSVGAKLTARPRFERNWTSPASSPDGRWLVFVPLERITQHVGPGFAARAAARLEAVRLDAPSEPLTLALDLPGLTGQPAFSRDGRWLYFVQFFSDTNHDGVIDGSDHGVLFRVPFAAAADAPARLASVVPVQLTDSGSNCQYPAPARERLIATCSQHEALDVYALPLDGEVPSAWPLARLRSEIELSAVANERLLLYRHVLARETELSSQRLTTMRLLRLHLEKEEFDAADFYVEKVAKLHDPTTRGIVTPLRALVAERRARSAEEHGRGVQDFREQARALLQRLSDGPNDSAAARALNRLVSSEILDFLGDKAEARRELEAVVLEDDTPRSIVEAYFLRADALYRELDDRAALVALCRRLAARAHFKPEVRLDYAQTAVRALVRGRPTDEALALLAKERAGEPGDTDLAFALELGEALLAVRSAHPGAAPKARLLELYAAQTRLDRKRALVLDAVERGSDVDADSVIEAVATRYLDDVAPETDEGRRASRLYRRALMGRAFRRLAKGRITEARADFDAVYQRTGSFEAVIEAMALRLRQAEQPAAIEAELGPRAKTPAMTHFIKAYLLASELPQLKGGAHAKAVEHARAELRAGWSVLKNKGPVHLLYGVLMHEQYLRSGDASAAETASGHYTLALELMQNEPRARASLLGELGLLHMQVGNYRMALGYLEQRLRLPFGDAFDELTTRLAYARSLFHVEREADGAAAADEALTLLDRTPALASYRPLVLDRAALYNLAAERYARALLLYDEEVRTLARDSTPAAARNHFVVRLAQAAAALGAKRPARALDDLDALDPLFDDRTLGKQLGSEHVSADQAVRSYRALAAGLRANASSALGRANAAFDALLRERSALAERFTHSDRDEDLRALELVETELAQNAAARRDFPAATRWLGLALDHADTFLARTHAGIDSGKLVILWLGAALQGLDHAPAGFDVPKRLAAAHEELVARHDPAFRHYERWLEIYLTLTALTSR